MCEFTHYYGRHKQQNKSVTQTTVSQNKSHILKFRVDDQLFNQINDKCREKDKCFSELNRILWLAYFETEKNIAWQKEIAEWEEKS